LQSVIEVKGDKEHRFYLVLKSHLASDRKIKPFVSIAYSRVMSPLREAE